MALFLAALPAAADPVAEALYEEGAKALQAGRLDAACEKLAASLEREPLSGTLMTLAQCESLRGRTATAWDQYKRAATMAHNERRDAYEKRARELAAELEPKLTRLEIVADAAVVVTVDGQVLAPATYGLAIPLDPGVHPIEATADGFQPWSTTANLREEGQTVRIEVPPLVALAPQPPPGPTPTPAPGGGDTTAPPAPEGGIPWWTWVGISVVPAAAVSAGVFGTLNAAARDDIVANCGEDRQSCLAGFDFEARHGDEALYAGLGWGFGILGGLGLVAGVTGLVIGLTADEPAAAWIPTLETDGRSAGLTWRGSF